MKAWPLVRSVRVWCLFGLFTASVALPPPEVQTNYGPVKGAWREGGVAAFYRVPYAASTAGAARWRPAQAPQPWSEPIDGTRPLGMAGGCLQVNPFPGAGVWQPVDQTLGVEDCLMLMVYSPALDGNAPVLFWIHGGAFVIGDAWMWGQQDGAELARRFGVVVVSVQYRLGPLGFLALEGGPRSNQGLLDQRFALRWLQEHAARFGGDPRRVVIAGESAGGYSVCWHVASPGSRGLFAGGIMESGGCDTNLPLEKAKQIGRVFMRANGCADLDCMRALDARTLLQRATSDPEASQNLWNVWPTVDFLPEGLPDTQLRLLRSGRGSRVPVIFGHNSNELQVGCLQGQALHKCDGIMSLLGGHRVNASMVRASLERDAESLGLQRLRHLSDGDWAAVLRKYPLEDYSGSQSSRLSAIWTDLDWEGPNGEGGSLTIGQCGTLRAVRAAAAGGGSAYMYRYDYHTRALNTSDRLVQHGDEVSFVFQDHALLQYSRQAKQVVRLMGAYWTSFVATLDPNVAPLAHWPVFAGDNGQLLHITGPEPRTEEPSRRAFCDFWQELLTEPPRAAGKSSISTSTGLNGTGFGAQAVLLAFFCASAAAGIALLRRSHLLGRGVSCDAYEAMVDGGNA